MFLTWNTLPKLTWGPSYIFNVIKSNLETIPLLIVDADNMDMIFGAHEKVPSFVFRISGGWIQ